MNEQIQELILSDAQRPFLMFLIGPPLSGKDTLLRQLFIPGNVQIISRDQIILDQFDTEDYDTAYSIVDHKLIDKILLQTFIKANSDRKSVIVNMTNMSSKRRLKTMSYFDKDYRRFAVQFPILTWEEYMERNQKRNLEEGKTIPDSVIQTMIASFEEITEKEKFDKVIYL